MNNRMLSYTGFLIGLIGIWSWVVLPAEVVGPVSGLLGYIGGTAFVHFAKEEA